MSTRCSDCGASTDARSCEELFHHLLELDYQGEQPFASFHAVNVACYVLQHPSEHRPAHTAVQRKLVETFCDAGLEGLHELTAAARARNSHTGRASGTDVFPLGSPDVHVAASAGSPNVTIHDVAVDGTFPADGYADRMSAWATAVRAGWSVAPFSA